MALSGAQVTAFTDSLAKACDSFNTNFVSGTLGAANAIIAGVGGTGVSQTTGRVLNWLDLVSEVDVIDDMQAVATSITTYLTSIRSLNTFYQRFFPVLNDLDLALGGLNAFLTTNTLQISAYIANAFANFQAIAVSGGFRSSAAVPAIIVPANYFPYAAVDNLWNITCSGATTFSTNVVGSSPSTSVAGGGVGQLYIYKNNSGNATGGAALVIQYIKGDGTTGTVTYNTTSGTPTGSGSLAAGFAITGAIGSSIVSVSGSGMTNLEQYTIGCQLVRSPSY
jgi:hypothetical protein